MIVKIGTFNVNNLFSRFNFTGAIDEIKSGGTSGAMTIRYEFTDPGSYHIRTYLGKLVKAKDIEDTKTIAKRILAMNVDVLAVQEVENIDILKEFNKNHLEGLYSTEVLIEGNDPRFIDVGLLSKLPIGAITSFQTAVHLQEPGKRVFSRDLLEVEILDPTGLLKLFTMYITHLKSHFGDDENDGQGKVDNNTRRQRQAEKISEIVGDRMKTEGKYIVAGDMNDPPNAAPLQPMLTINGNQLFNAMANPQETRPSKPETGGHEPQSHAWTHRFKKSGQPPQHELFDHIWLSSALAPTFEGSFIDRRTKHGGDGSDHDPAWVQLNI
jgi:endonuclease/exonuclease/phosphatase family metal-dependent hydrolase